MKDLKLHCRLHREPDTNEGFLCQQAVGDALRIECRHIVRRTGRAVDKPEQRIVGIRGKACLRMLCAEAPAILGLVTGKAAPAITAQILEKSVCCRLYRSARLKCRDLATRIIIDLHLRND